MKIANNIPIVIQEGKASIKSEQHAKPREFRVIYWVGLVANALFPLGELFGGIWYSVCFYNAKLEPPIPIDINDTATSTI